MYYINRMTINTLLLSGGGVKGIAYCGVFRKLQELPKDILDIKVLCGVSIGSMFGLIYLMGYTYEEIREEIMCKNFVELKDVRISHFLNDYGLDSGKKIMSWLETLMIKRGFDRKLTFKQLYDKTGVCFKVLATNLQRYCFTEFDHVNTPNFQIRKAIRMSIGLPFVFTKQQYKGEVHVDGGIINNYPIEMFKETLDTVLGVRLLSNTLDNIGNEGEELSREGENGMTIDKYIYHVFACYAIQRENAKLDELYKNRTILVSTSGLTNTINFSLDGDEKQILMDLGYKATEEYFKQKKIL